MMKNADMPANPVHEVKGVGDVITSNTSLRGLTKRETMAMHFMAAWIQHHGSSNDYGFSQKDAAISAIECADALLSQLETKNPA
ncbi:hypothetical protein M3908_002914 [Vibrio metschnikovii]|nr:hypothetical protein [Vibrio metschnikovii]